MKFIIDKIIKYSTFNFVFVSTICYIKTNPHQRLQLPRFQALDPRIRNYSHKK